MKFRKQKPKRRRIMGRDYFPTITELTIAADRGMTPEEYCKAVNDAIEYEKQIESESEWFDE